MVLFCTVTFAGRLLRRSRKVFLQLRPSIIHSQPGTIYYSSLLLLLSTATAFYVDLFLMTLLQLLIIKIFVPTFNPGGFSFLMTFGAPQWPKNRVTNHTVLSRSLPIAGTSLWRASKPGHTTWSTSSCTPSLSTSSINFRDASSIPQAV